VIFLLFFLVADTLIFTNPRVVEDSTVNFVTEEAHVDTVSQVFNFEGSKGVFVVFQGLNLDLSQSLDLKLQGKLTESMTLSARLKDNFTYYGSDYYSKSLGDLDEIYLSVRDRRGLSLDLGKFFYEGRKLLGFEADYKDYEAVYGSTEQTRKKKVIEYRDFYDGPYFVDYGYLIVPGSVQVFLNGFTLDKANYSFDYSTGSLYFKGLRILPGDVIYVEYSTYSYAPSLFSGVRGRADHFIFELKRLNSAEGFYSGFPAEILDYLRMKGDSCASEPYRGGIRTGKGDYILQDSIYVFVGQGRGDYQVYFKFKGQGQGSYVFDNLIGGYKFVGKGNGLYEPEIDLYPPTDFLLGKFSYDGLFRFSGRMSYRDLNTLSPKDDGDNLGYDFELGRDFHTKAFDFQFNWRNRSSNFSTIDGEIDPLWGTEDKGFSHQFNLFFDSKKVGTSLKSSVRVAEEKVSYLVSLVNQVGPFHAQGILSKTDTLDFKMLAGFDFKKLPSLNLLISKGSSAKAFLYDSLHGFEYLIGFNFGLAKRVSLFSKAGFNYNSDENHLSAKFFYLPEYQKTLLYSLVGTSKLVGGLSVIGSFSFVPVFLPLQEERYYPSPMGMFNYDERTGIFVPDINGGYERELVVLGVMDTTLQKSYSFGVDFDYTFVGSARFERTYSEFTDYTLISVDLRKNQLEFNWQRSVRNLSNVLNGRKTENSEIGLKFPLLKPIFLNLKYRDCFETPVNYSIWSGYLTFTFTFMSLTSGLDYTYFDSVNFPGLHLEGSVFKASDKFRVVGSYYLNFPLNSPSALPTVLPTAKRYGVNLSIKRPFGSGEFFIDGFYSKSLTATSKVRAGYNFLF